MNPGDKADLISRYAFSWRNVCSARELIFRDGVKTELTDGAGNDLVVISIKVYTLSKQLGLIDVVCLRNNAFPGTQSDCENCCKDYLTNHFSITYNLPFHFRLQLFNYLNTCVLQHQKRSRTS
jgi:hypothetical protein